MEARRLSTHQGAGPIGLLFTAVAKLSDIHPIIVSEPSPTRRALAQKVGACSGLTIGQSCSRNPERSSSVDFRFSASLQS
jgi:threonine dehydrogenase-like Zn-dependent dehydrogenase